MSLACSGGVREEPLGVVLLLVVVVVAVLHVAVVVVAVAVVIILVVVVVVVVVVGSLTRGEVEGRGATRKRFGCHSVM